MIEAEAKILASRRLWPRGLNITPSALDVCSYTTSLSHCVYGAF